MKKQSNRLGMVLLICLLGLVLAGLVGTIIYLDREEAARLSDPTAVPTTSAPSTTAPTTPAPTTPAPETTPAPTTPPPTTPPPTTPAPLSLSMDQDPAEKITVWEETVTLSGVADPGREVTALDGTVTAQPGEDGKFQLQLPVEMGKQQITLTCGEEAVTYDVERRYAVQFFTPEEDTYYYADQTLYIWVSAREGSKVSVQFQGEEVELRIPVDQKAQGLMDGFVLYKGAEVLPYNLKEEKNMGPITVTTTCDGITEVYHSKDIICGARVSRKESDPSVTPEGYWDVGSGYIVEVIDVSVETLSSKGSHDKSDPRNNYLPKGTVDYGTKDLVVNQEGGQTYRMLRCGVRVYNEVKNSPSPYSSRAVDCYYGILPDHNEINIADMSIEGHHTLLTLDCLWKAPFYFDYEEQEYENAAKRKFFVEEFNARYVDITFCYATQLTGTLEIAPNHPLFQSAEIIQNPADMTLRLWLKKAGGLIGWDAYYNEDDQLVFKFLNPVTVTKAENAYGADLSGVVIMLDVGHGGEDIGAVGTTSNGTSYMEKGRNMALANAVKKELESIGATVIMNRYDNSELVMQRERIMFLKEVAPDFCLAIHHNWSDDPQRQGFETGFFTTFSQRPTEHIYETTKAAKIYNGVVFMWHYYYVARQTICPIVLTENGFMSYPKDLERAIYDSYIEKKAKSLTQGIANYYLEQSGLYTLVSTRVDQVSN